MTPGEIANATHPCPTMPIGPLCVTIPSRALDDRELRESPNPGQVGDHVLCRGSVEPLGGRFRDGGRILGMHRVPSRDF